MAILEFIITAAIPVSFGLLSAFRSCISSPACASEDAFCRRQIGSQSHAGTEPVGERMKSSRCRPKRLLEPTVQRRAPDIGRIGGQDPVRRLYRPPGNHPPIAPREPHQARRVKLGIARETPKISPSVPRASVVLTRVAAVCVRGRGGSVLWQVARRTCGRGCSASVPDMRPENPACPHLVDGQLGSSTGEEVCLAIYADGTDCLIRPTPPVHHHHLAWHTS